MATTCEGLRDSLVHLFYPTKCLHCSVLLDPGTVVLCSTCSSSLEVIDPSGRCTSCFHELDEENAFVCGECLHHQSAYLHIASVFDYEGTASSLVKQLKYGNKPYLSEGMGAFLAAQWHMLQWPIPDAIIAVPISFSRLFDRGYNQSALLAKKMGVLLGCPVLDALHRRSGDFSQAALTLKQRKALNQNTFTCNINCPIEGKTLLVIDDVITSGATLQRCGEALLERKAASLYALTFCKTRLVHCQP